MVLTDNRHVLLSVTLAFLWLCPGFLVFGDDQPQGFLERLSNFGSRITSGIRGNRDDDTSASHKSAQETARGTETGRAGSAFRRGGDMPLAPRPDPLLSRPPASEAGEGPAISDTRTAQAVAAQGIKAAAPPETYGKEPASGPQLVAPVVADNQDSTQAVVDSATRTPLYARVMEYRSSPFSQPEASSARSESTQAMAAEPGSSGPPRNESLTPRQEVRVEATNPSGLAQRPPSSASPVGPATATASRGGPASRQPQTAVAVRTPAQTVPAVNAPASSEASRSAPGVKPTPAVASQTAGDTSRERSPDSSKVPVPAIPPRTGMERQPTPASPTLAARPTSENVQTELRTPGPTVAKSPASVATEPSRSPLTASTARDANSTGGTPVLRVETLGPRSVTRGKPARYEIAAKNTGEREALDVRITVNIPRGAEVLSRNASAGQIEAEDRDAGALVLWTLPRIAAAQTERLILELVPRDSRPIELALHYTFTPPPTHTQIEVQEPKLELSVEGPSEVVFGSAQVYRVVLSNKGTAEAEDVLLTLYPPGNAQREPITQPLGSVKPGEARIVELELVAREAGVMQILMEATATNQTSTRLEHQVVVVKPALEVAVDGPALQFVGEEATYVLTVANPGTAPAENLRIVVQCSSALEPVIQAIKGARINGQKIEWSLPVLGAGERQTIEIPCRFKMDGEVRLIVQATAEGGLAAQSQISTSVKAMPSLVMRIEDPGRPVPLGQEGIYQILVHNKGSKAASAVQIVGFFSEGIEPVAADGKPARILPGQVIFDPIDRIEPGEQLKLTIRARAEHSGNHIFRAEVLCPSSEIQLAAEATTHYFDPVLAERPSGSGSRTR